ncbi:MAG: metal ABC transporter permease [Nitrospinae bacterium]|nr:metal ABC transporter permease [Nitrospinota bacterium]
MSFVDALVHYSFLQNAFIAGILVSAVCSILSVYIVFKKMAFIGQGISHSAFGGVAAGIYFFGSGEESVFYVQGLTLLFCVGVALMIGWMSRKHLVSEDSAIGIFFVASMAIGIVFISLRQEYTNDIFNYLFGNILAVSLHDIWLICALTTIVLLTVWGLFKEFKFYCFDEEIAEVYGIPTSFLHYLLLVLIAVTIIISIKAIGIILVSAFLVIPAASARLLSRNYSKIFLLSFILGQLSNIVGLWISFQWEIPSGASVVLALTFFFILSYFFAEVKRK